MAYVFFFSFSDYTFAATQKTVFIDLITDLTWRNEKKNIDDNNIFRCFSLTYTK